MLWVVAGAGVVAVVDWAAVARGRARTRWVSKPLTLVLLIAAAFVGGADGWIVAGLVLGLVGDVALLSDAGAAFLVGLAAFLLGHVAYLIAFVAMGLHSTNVALGVVFVAVIAGYQLGTVLRAAAAAEGRAFAVVVGGYAAVLGAMAVCAEGTHHFLIGAGGLAFVASDTMLATERFVRSSRSCPLFVIVTYHLAQFLIVVGVLDSV